jgi:hypothetical protein
MSIKCEKCGAENENGAKFCKSCGTALNIEPKQTVSVESNNTTLQTVKKVVLWIGIAFVIFTVLINMVEFINAKNEDSKIRELRNSCANNDAQACYKLGTASYNGNNVFSSEKSLSDDEKHEALAKSCKLGNKDGCREGGYYERGCELQDGESCYHFGLDKAPLGGGVICSVQPDSSECKKYEEYYRINTKPYLDRACEYGYSQGCL